LNVALNGIGRPGAESLSELAACPALTELRLDLNRNKIGDGGALGLRRLAGAPRLARLRLFVFGCDLTDACVRPGPVRQGRRPEDPFCPTDRPVPRPQRLAEFERAAVAVAEVHVVRPIPAYPPLPDVCRLLYGR
jgi:hypothetical protein